MKRLQRCGRVLRLLRRKLPRVARDWVQRRAMNFGNYFIGFAEWIERND